jgi:hypothetical protein
MVFSEAESGEPHGYIDEWRGDGCFHYTGEGQKGDQLMKSGNAAILRHAAEGRALRMFNGARGRVTYEGAFELASDLAARPTRGRNRARQGHRFVDACRVLSYRCAAERDAEIRVRA